MGTDLTHRCGCLFCRHVQQRQDHTLWCCHPDERYPRLICEARDDSAACGPQATRWEPPAETPHAPA